MAGRPKIIKKRIYLEKKVQLRIEKYKSKYYKRNNGMGTAKIINQAIHNFSESNIRLSYLFKSSKTKKKDLSVIYVKWNELVYKKLEIIGKSLKIHPGVLAGKILGLYFHEDIDYIKNDIEEENK